MTDCAMHDLFSQSTHVFENKIPERFIRFFKVRDDKSTSKLTQAVSSVLNFFDDVKAKLVGQTSAEKW